MLVDSFRPGRLTWQLCAVFVLVLLAPSLLPSAPQRFFSKFTASGGMEPTLLGPSHGTPDRLIVDRIHYLFSQPQRGDLVVFRTSGIPAIRKDTMFVERVVGLPGEKIEIRDGRLFADGRQLGADDGIPDIYYLTKDEIIYGVPANSYFVLGDNSPNSFDSRYWGYLPQGNIYGRISRIYYPLDRISVPR